MINGNKVFSQDMMVVRGQMVFVEYFLEETNCWILKNTNDYITMASQGNGSYFGDLSTRQ